jgi:hypothetical protein
MQDTQITEEDLPIVEKMNLEVVQEFATNRNFTHHHGMNGFKL